MTLVHAHHPTALSPQANEREPNAKSVLQSLHMNENENETRKLHLRAPSILQILSEAYLNLIPVYPAALHVLQPQARPTPFTRPRRENLRHGDLPKTEPTNQRARIPQRRPRHLPRQAAKWSQRVQEVAFGARERVQFVSVRHYANDVA